MEWLRLYFIVINVVGFLSMFSDKKRAKQKRWRISEKTLFLIASIGGSLGGIIGMYVFHHKTRHWQFKYGFPVILIIQIIIAYTLLFYK